MAKSLRVKNSRRARSIKAQTERNELPPKHKIDVERSKKAKFKKIARP